MIYECADCRSRWKIPLLRCPHCKGERTIVPKNTVHGGPTDITFPPLDPRERGDRPTVDPQDPDELREQQEKAQQEDAEAREAADEDDEDEVERRPGRDANDDGQDVDTPTPAEGDSDARGLLRAEGTADVVRAEPVPTGNVDDVKRWVGDDPDKAKRALDAEKARTGPERTGLVRHLERVQSMRDEDK